nr:hypothetical protein [Tanacetum cinerariifolium]
MFIPKMAELMLLIRNVRKNVDAAKAFDWKRDRNLLHSDKEGSTGIGSHGKVLKDNLLDHQRLYMGRETGKEGSGVGMILDSPEGKVYSYAIHLNFYASKDNMDYETMLVGLVTSAGRGIKDLHVFVDSKMLVDQVEGSRIPRTKEDWYSLTPSRDKLERLEKANAWYKLVIEKSSETERQQLFKIKELQDENEILKSKVLDCTKCQSFQEKLKELNSINESLTTSVQKLLNSHERGKAKLTQRDEKISILQKELRLLEEQSKVFHEVKEYQKKDKIRSKPDKNGKRGEAGKSQKQLQSVEKVILKKMQKEGPEMQIIQSFIKERRKTGADLQ